MYINVFELECVWNTNIDKQNAFVIVLCKKKIKFIYEKNNIMIVNFYIVKFYHHQTHSSSNTLIYIRSYEYPTE